MNTRSKANAAAQAASFSAAIRAALPRKKQAVEERVLRMAHLCTYVGLGKSTIYAMIARGSFPAPDVRLGANSVGWFRETVDSWLESRRIATIVQ